MERKKNSRSNRNKDKNDKNTDRITELVQLEHKLSTTSQFKLINTNNKLKVYKIHINKNDQFRLIIPFDSNQSIKLKSNDVNVENFKDLNKITRNVIENFNFKVKTNKEYNCLFFINYLINNIDNLKLDNKAFKEHEVQKLKIVV